VDANPLHLEKLIDKARAEYASLMQSLSQGTRTTQAVLLLAAVTILLTVAHLRDRLQDVTPGEFPAIGLAPVCMLVCALLVMRKITLQTTAFSLAQLKSLGAQPLIDSARSKVTALMLQGCATFDAIVCHKAALAVPTGLLTGQLQTLTVMLLTWRNRATMRNLIEMMRVNVRSVVDERKLRLMLSFLGLRLPIPANTASVFQHFTFVRVNDDLSAGASGRPASINLLC
jgi:hypothetical protein